MLSVAIITHNEEDHIVECLESVKNLADEIIIVDCESTDSTVELARRYTDKIFFQKNDPNLNVNKSFAIEKASGDWILYLDPDEVVTAELAEEISNVVKVQSGNTCDGYFMPRKNFYFYKFLCYGGKYPDYQLRLFRKNKAYFPKIHVHERLVVPSRRVCYLRNPILHYTYKNIREFIEKLNFYTSFEARFLYKKGVRHNLGNFIKYVILLPVRRFLDRYILRLGFLDGMVGLYVCIMESLFYPIAYFKLIIKNPEELGISC
jgi:glycosyltransferase involved in cell wall biosynthesis